MSFLTDLSPKIISLKDYLLHLVDPNDNTQNVAGSSFKITFDDARQGIMSVAKFTAFAGGGQGSAILLTAYKNNVETVSSTGDSAKPKPATVGYSFKVKNNGANAMDFFPSSGHNFKGIAVDTAIPIAVGIEIEFTCYTAGEYE
ncbi:MAG: hypothetical protein ACUZ8H_16105 [Candidatus Anammoxibacter sp.]